MVVRTPRLRGPECRWLLLASQILWVGGCTGTIGDEQGGYPAAAGGAPTAAGSMGSTTMSGAAGRNIPDDGTAGPMGSVNNVPTAGRAAPNRAGAGGTTMATAGSSGVAGTSMHTGGAGAGGSAAGAGGQPSSAGSGGSSGGELVPGGVRWLGRVDASNPNAARFSWSGAGFVGVVQGTTVAVKLRTEGTDTVFFQAVIDGATGMRFEVKSGADRTVTVASGLSNADHQVELYRETEGLYGVSTFLGFTSGTLKGAPAAGPRSIELVGDSITTGFGDLGMESHPNGPTCTWSAAVSSWFVSYGAIAGRELNAEVSTVAHSGWGLIRDGNGNTSGNLPSVYDDMLGSSGTPDWNFSRQPSAVVINLGTNDWQKGDPGTTFENAYGDFIKHIRTHYPNAWIFLTIGSMFPQDVLNQVDARLKTVVAARASAGDTKVSTFDLGSQNSSMTGCVSHPSAADHKRMAAILKQQLMSKLGW